MLIPKAVLAPVVTLVVLVMAVMLVVAVGVQRNNSQITQMIHNECVDRNAAAMSVNLVLDQLIAGAEDSKAFTVAEKRDRITLWHAVRQNVIACAQP